MLQETKKKKEILDKFISLARIPWQIQGISQQYNFVVGIASPTSSSQPRGPGAEPYHSICLACAAITGADAPASMALRDKAAVPKESVRSQCNVDHSKLSDHSKGGNEKMSLKTRNDPFT
jgi:hypothetical protein